MIVMIGERSNKSFGSSSSTSSKLSSSTASSFVTSTLYSIQMSWIVSSSKFVLMVTILPNMNNNLMMSLEFLFNFSASSLTVIPSSYAIFVTSSARGLNSLCVVPLRGFLLFLLTGLPIKITYFLLILYLPYQHL